MVRLFKQQNDHLKAPAIEISHHCWQYFAVDMKARSMFLLSLILMIGALLLVLKGRGQLNEAFQAWHRGDQEVFRQFAHRGAWFLYPAWALAAGGVACLFASYRRRERAWRWAVVVLFGLFLLLGLAPA